MTLRTVMSMLQILVRITYLTYHSLRPQSRPPLPSPTTTAIATPPSTSAIAASSTSSLATETVPSISSSTSPSGVISSSSVNQTTSSVTQPSTGQSKTSSTISAAVLPPSGFPWWWIPLAAIPVALIGVVLGFRRNTNQDRRFSPSRPPSPPGTPTDAFSHLAEANEKVES